jgi:hypothetical protein
MYNITKDFLLAVAEGKVPGYKIVNKWGRNPDISTTEEAVWNGGGPYTGFDATTEDTVEVFGGVNDIGSLVSSGALTVKSVVDTEVVDLTADFVSDGVAVGDLYINDTCNDHAVITAVEKTKLTFRLMADKQPNNAGDSYRVATAAGTGAAVLHLKLGYDADLNLLGEHIILNGTTPVDSINKYFRCFRGSCDLVGSAKGNVAEITVRQKATPLNVFAKIPIGYNQSMIAALTVEKGHEAYLVFHRVSLANRNVAEATGKMLAAEFGSKAFKVQDEAAASTTGSTANNRPYPLVKGPYREGTDMVMRATASASVAIFGEFDVLLVDKRIAGN